MNLQWVHRLLAKANGKVRGCPIVRGLPERGWPLGVVLAFLINPPKWFVGASFAAIACVGFSLLVLLLLGSALGHAEGVNKFLLGLGGLLGVPFLVWRTWIADQAKKTAQETHYTSLLKTAVDQLGATREQATEDGSKKNIHNTEHRIGAIYALEKLAYDYKPLHWPIMEILCAYVRENAGSPKPASDEIRAIYLRKTTFVGGIAKEWKERADALEPPRVDVQAALTVIGRRLDKQRD